MRSPSQRLKLSILFQNKCFLHVWIFIITFGSPNIICGVGLVVEGGGVGGLAQVTFFTYYPFIELDIL